MINFVTGGLYSLELHREKSNVAVRPQEVSNVLSATDAVSYSQIHDILQQAREQTKRSINQTMLQAYWQVGKLIVEHKQGRQNRAVYGAKTLQSVAQKLSSEFGKAFSASNLQNFRQFYLNYTHKEICYTQCSELGWSHLRLLMRMPDAVARRWYAQEAVSRT